LYEPLEVDLTERTCVWE